MTYKSTVLLLFLITAFFSCKSQQPTLTYSSEDLKIIPLSKNSFVHISYLSTGDFGKVACNGLIYINQGQAVVFDTPTDNETSEELIHWITETKKQQIKAVVINHFHDDCLGGIEAFHELSIPSYASNTTIELAKKEGNPVPQIGFDTTNELTIGKQKIINRHFGEAHTKDNIVSYIPSEHLLFGGCALKSLNAAKGYLGDANTNEWGNTIKKIKAAYPDLKTAIPGHGEYGGSELLDYTISLFSTKQ
ncbi:subclass B1 metallo-beta-lactamase ZOG-1 [Zobellia galactanivorans]|uniref:beta-lactamase n=1 Tax=Zobellia galactanivorans (strain DSM 12802 / CCUG 47099 / CIP 106680 / NCIMB 13871 / Dsij) TaxID=63186 RepID=G0L217_ZOBGA|nr:subclass B1 metallo-beta-lactamase ZOG-1 [Zobellia galactanivorans]CAZ94871.1 Metallo-beta-lactamase [Zobellia galactanivorans]